MTLREPLKSWKHSYKFYQIIDQKAQQHITDSQNSLGEQFPEKGYILVGISNS
jgi:hypothetical protein